MEFIIIYCHLSLFTNIYYYLLLLIVIYYYLSPFIIIHYCSFLFIALKHSFIAGAERWPLLPPLAAALPPSLSQSKATVALRPPSLRGRSADTAALLRGLDLSSLCLQTKRAWPNLLLYCRDGARPLLLTSAATLPPPCRKTKRQWPRVLLSRGERRLATTIFTCGCATSPLRRQAQSGSGLADTSIRGTDHGHCCFPRLPR